jgi:hypothetical protein
MSEEADKETIENTDQSTPANEPASTRKPFTWPKLTVYGDIVERTRRGHVGSDNNKSGGGHGG